MTATIQCSDGSARTYETEEDIKRDGWVADWGFFDKGDEVSDGAAEVFAEIQLAADRISSEAQFSLASPGGL